MIDISASKQWILNLAAVLAESNRVPLNSIALGNVADKQNIDAWKQALERDWGVTNHHTLKENIDWLEKTGHNKNFLAMMQRVNYLSSSAFYCFANNQYEETSNKLKLAYQHRFTLEGVGIYAWDIGRMVFLIRQGVYVGYMKESEAWAKLYTTAEAVQRAFVDWYHYGVSYVVGRHYWRGSNLSDSNCSVFYTNLNPIVGDIHSDWHTLPWDTPLN